MQFSITFAALNLLAGMAAAHPGHSEKREIAERAAFLKNKPRDLSQCASKMKARGLEARAAARRAATANQARRKRSIKARDNEATVLATSHLSNSSYDTTTDESVIFASDNSTCILSPEVTQGPYYVSGEYVRKNLTESETGVELILDTQVIDMATCEPVTNAVVEIWNCNATGVYSGIVTQGNGDSSDLTNINSTFLRGLQPTDADGVAQFATIFPGHYTSRSNHIHVLAHFNGTVLANGTYSGGYVSHVGQLFFDQDLITEVEATSPYSTNSQPVTLNSADSVLASETATTSDPVVEYSLLGSSVSDGVFAWVSFGIDLTNEFTLTPAASLYASGGVEN